MEMKSDVTKQIKMSSRQSMQFLLQNNSLQFFIASVRIIVYVMHHQCIRLLIDLYGQIAVKLDGL